MQDSTLAAVPIPAAPNGLDQAQFEADKRAVYKHPLFSLLALLLEKCEQATQGYISSQAPTTTSNSNSNSSSPTANGNCDGDSFSRDIQAFVQILEKEKRPLLTNDSELDGLMIKALQVLRIHLLELEKVQELCRDFCTRYIACLRGKMQSENLLRADYPLDGSHANLSNSNSPTNSPEQDHIGNSQTQTSGGYYASSNNDFLAGGGGAVGGGDGPDFSNLQVPLNFHNTTGSSSNTIPSVGHLLQQQLEARDARGANIADTITTTAAGTSPGQLHNNGSPATTGNGVGASSITNTAVNELHSILGSTPLSQIGCPMPLNLDQYAGQLSPCGSSDEDLDSDGDSNNDDIGSNFSNSNSSKRQKRGILPKHATSVMRAWLFQHLVHPYPTEDEKRTIAAQTNLTLLQVNNWFINARRRILQPMLEHANDNSRARKKQSSASSPGTESEKRYWADSTNGALIDPNIENISANMNRVDSERLLAAATQKLAAADRYSSEESNDEGLVIDHHQQQESA